MDRRRRRKGSPCVPNRQWREGLGRIPNATPPQQPDRVSDLFFLDQQRGWLTTWNHIDDGEGTYLYSTVDGGKHWTADPDLSFQGKGKEANVVRFTSRERGFVFFSDGIGQRLAYTTDGGTHWSQAGAAGIRRSTARSSKAISCAVLGPDSAS